MIQASLFMLKHFMRHASCFMLHHLSTAAMKSTPALPRPSTLGLALVDPSPPLPSLAWSDIATRAEALPLHVVRREVEVQNVAGCMFPEVQNVAGCVFLVVTCTGPAAASLGMGELLLYWLPYGTLRGCWPSRDVILFSYF